MAARAAEGHASKLIAYELGLALGTVASHLRKATRKPGVSGRVELAKLYRLALEAEARPQQLAGEALRISSRPEASLPAGLTEAKAETLELLQRGATNAEVAAARGVRLETVENQLSALYRKLSVSSRAELVARFG